MEYFNINNSLVNSYLKDDIILNYKKDLTDTTISRWLDESSAKRYTYSLVYEDLLFNRLGDKKILDIGGGLSYVTCYLLKNFKNYYLCDILAHDKEEIIQLAHKQFGEQLVEKDWGELDLSDFDIIIANDIFPNVDQRLALFLDRIRNSKNSINTYMSLTCYDNFRSYKTKRLDGEEIFWFAGWTSNQLKAILDENFPQEKNTIRKAHESLDYSLYSNGRTTFFMKLP